MFWSHFFHRALLLHRFLFSSFCCVWGHTLRCSELTPGDAQGVSGMESGSAACKTSAIAIALDTVLLLHFTLLQGISVCVTLCEATYVCQSVRRT